MNKFRTLNGQPRFSIHLSADWLIILDEAPGNYQVTEVQLPQNKVLLLHIRNLYGNIQELN